jgi:plastocyanin
MRFSKSLLLGLATTLMTMLLVIGGLWTTSSVAFAASTNVQMGSSNGMLVFEPAEITVAPGDTVHYEVGGVPPHNVVFDGNLSSLSHPAMIMSGGFDVAIPADTAPGTYSFYCEPHRGAGMVGKITVKG